MSRAFFNDIMTLGILGIGGYLIYTKTDWFQQGLQTIKELIGEIKGGSGGGPLIDLGGGGSSAGGGGGGGPISQTGSCPGGTTCGPCRPQSGGIRCECNNYKGSEYEATFCGTWSGDDLSIKMWGPTHSSSSDCCWCILNTSPDGKMRMRGEGKHPDTSDLGITGDVGGKPTCVKAVITKGPKGAHVEGYGLVGGVWKKGLTYDGPCGLGGNVLRDGAHPNQQVSFRVDGQMKSTCATVKPLANAAYASAGQYSTSLFTNNRPYYSQAKISNMR